MVGLMKWINLFLRRFRQVYLCLEVYYRFNAPNGFSLEFIPETLVAKINCIWINDLETFYVLF